MMGRIPDIWIKARLRSDSALLDRSMFEMLAAHKRKLNVVGLDIMTGDETAWFHPVAPYEWLSRSYEEVALADFDLTSILILRRALRPVSISSANPAPLPKRISTLAAAVEAWGNAGILTAGGRDSVETVFSDVASFLKWADEGEFPRSYTHPPFCAYPRSTS